MTPLYLALLLLSPSPDPLGHEDYRVREAYHSALGSLPVLNLPTAVKGAVSPDLEVRTRSRDLFHSSLRALSPLFRAAAAYRLITDESPEPPEEDLSREAHALAAAMKLTDRATEVGPLDADYLLHDYEGLGFLTTVRERYKGRKK